MTKRKLHRSDSPYEDFPGYIEFPVMLTAEEFLKWDKATQDEPEQSNLPVPFRQFTARHHFVDFHIQGVDATTAADASGTTWPAAALIYWMVRETEIALIEAMSSKNLRDPSSTT